MPPVVVPPRWPAVVPPRWPVAVEPQPVEVWIEVEDEVEDEHKEVEEEEDNDYEMVKVESCQQDNEEVIKTTYAVLQQHRDHLRQQRHRHGQQQHCQQRRCQQRDCWQPFKVRKGHRSSPPRRTRRCKATATYKSRHAKLDDKRCVRKVEVSKLRYSQFSCKESFQCGRSVQGLVQDLLSRKVDMSAPFLRLTVFETTDEETKETVLRCIDNRRLFALKTYANKSKQDHLMVNIDFYSENTIHQVLRFVENSDSTPGKTVRLRRNRKK